MFWSDVKFFHFGKREATCPPWKFSQFRALLYGLFFFLLTSSLFFSGASCTNRVACSVLLGVCCPSAVSGLSLHTPCLCESLHGPWSSVSETLKKEFLWRSVGNPYPLGRLVSSDFQNREQISCPWICLPPFLLLQLFVALSYLWLLYPSLPQTNVQSLQH